MLILCIWSSKTPDFTINGGRSTSQLYNWAEAFYWVTLHWAHSLTLQIIQANPHLKRIPTLCVDACMCVCESYRLTPTLKESLLYVLMHVCAYAHIVFKSYRQLPIDMKIQGTCMCSLSMTRHIQMSSSFTLLGHPLYELPLLPQYMCTLQDTCQSIHLFDWVNRK
jgi:hypothetical protein